MVAAKPIFTGFNAGELSPLMDGRVDQDKYFLGCRELSNFLPTVQGPARRRGGTRFLNPIKTVANRSWLANFVFSASQAYILEFGDTYLRFWTNRGQLLSASVPYEITSPYAVADLMTAEGTFALRTLQSADVMWIVHAEGKYAPYRLSRLGATNWTLVPEVFTDGPFRDVNTDSTKTVYASAAGSVGASITLTANTAMFLAGHVGSLFRLSTFNPSTITPYQAAKSIAIGDRMRNAGNVYQSQTAFTYVAGDQTQRYVPTHTEGDAFDGAVTWRYLHSGYGWGQITAIGGGGTTATLAVSNYIPEECVGAGNTTRRWAFSEFSTVFGWPTSVSFYHERLTYTRGKQVFHSAVGGFNSFDRLNAGLVDSGTAMSLTLAADKLDNIRWAAQLRDLIIGTAQSESALGGQTLQAVYSATNVQNIPQAQYGSRLLRPLRVADSVLFVERAGHRIRDMRFHFEVDKYMAEDVTVLSEHLFDGSERVGSPEQPQRDIVDWCYQQQRDSIVWCVCSDGSLASLVLNRERGVLAWTPHYIGGNAIVESVQSIPSPDGRTDDLWMIVKRTINGSVYRSVEYLLDYRLVKLGAAEAVHVDCSTTYRGAPTTTVTVGTQFNGQTFSVCVDGSVHPDVVVASGNVVLQWPGSLIHTGYGFKSRLQTMRLEVQGQGGTSQTTRKAIGDLWVRLQSTIGGKIGPNFTKMDAIKTLDPSLPLGTPPPLFNGDVKVTFPGGFDTDCYICFMQDQPLPATVAMIVARVQVND